MPVSRGRRKAKKGRRKTVKRIRPKKKDFPLTSHCHLHVLVPGAVDGNDKHQRTVDHDNLGALLVDPVECAPGKKSTENGDDDAGDEPVLGVVALALHPRGPVIGHRLLGVVHQHLHPPDHPNGAEDVGTDQQEEGVLHDQQVALLGVHDLRGTFRWF